MWYKVGHPACNCSACTGAWPVASCVVYVHRPTAHSPSKSTAVLPRVHTYLTLGSEQQGPSTTRRGAVVSET